MFMDSASRARKDRRRIALWLTILGALARLLPHPPNFAPVDGLSLFSGARLRSWQAYAVPLILMAITDPILAVVYGVRAFGPAQIFIYGSFLISVWIGRRLLRANSGISRIAVASLLASAQFFLISNFAVWLLSSRDDAVYPLTWAGLLACYAAAIPFFGWTVLGDLVYTGAFFGLYAWLSRMSSADRVTTAA